MDSAARNDREVLEACFDISGVGSLPVLMTMVSNRVAYDSISEAYSRYKCECKLYLFCHDPPILPLQHAIIDLNIPPVLGMFTVCNLIGAG